MQANAEAQGAFMMTNNIIIVAAMFMFALTGLAVPQSQPLRCNTNKSPQFFAFNKGSQRPRPPDSGGVFVFRNEKLRADLKA